MRALDEITKANEATDSTAFPFSAALYHPERHFTNEQFANSAQNIATLRKDVITKLTASAPDGAGARQSLGSALHTIQDFYAHSNWEELGNSSPNTNLGTGSLANPPASLKACPSDVSTLGPNGGGGSTSGYFIAASLFGCGSINAGKCAHGNYTTSCLGINKDLDAALAASHGVPESPFHDTAVSIATTATTDFVQSIIDDLAGNDKALSALLDVKGDIAFVIDTTGSMSDEIGLVQGAVQRIVNTINSNPDSRPDNWILAPFNDPTWGPELTTSSADTLLSAVSALTASGGGDCPELAWHGIQLAVDNASPNSELYFFSDADSKDGDMADSVIAEAEKKSIKLSYFNTGSCSPPDPTYIQGAAATGGVFLFLQRPEDGIVDKFIYPLIAGNITRILSQQGPLPAGGAVAVPLPVDSTVSQLIVTVTADQPSTLQLLRPSGVPVSPTDPDVTITSFSVGMFVTVSSPAAGAWTARAAGTGNFSVIADANSTLELRDFNFVQANGDIHGGYFPIQGQPVQGSHSLGDATLLGPYKTAAFSLLDITGNKLSDLALTQNYPSAVPTDFVGAVTLPSAPFKISVMGLDSNGFAYQRQYSNAYQAVALTIAPAVQPGPSADILHLGSPVAVPFTVTNTGPATTFNITAIDSYGFISLVKPPSITLRTNASQTVNVTLLAPVSTPIGLVDTLTVTATDANNPSSLNSAIVSLTTAAAGVADLSIAESLSSNPSLAGSFLAYTITVHNAGPDDASNVVVTDTLPTGVIYTSGLCGGATVLTCNLGTLASGASKNFTVQVKIPADYLSSRSETTAQIANTATVTSSATDPHLTNNTNSVKTTVTAATYLKLTMTSSPNPVHEGDILTYTMNLTNTGPSDAIQGFILDYIPTGFTFVSSSILPCGGGVGTVLCNLGPVVPAGFTLSFPVRVRVPASFLQSAAASSDVVNTAMIMSDTSDLDPGTSPATVSTTVIH